MGGWSRSGSEGGSEEKLGGEARVWRGWFAKVQRTWAALGFGQGEGRRGGSSAAAAAIRVAGGAVVLGFEGRGSRGKDAAAKVGCRGGWVAEEKRTGNGEGKGQERGRREERDEEGESGWTVRRCGGNDGGRWVKLKRKKMMAERRTKEKREGDRAAFGARKPGVRIVSRVVSCPVSVFRRMRTYVAVKELPAEGVELWGAYVQKSTLEKKYAHALRCVRALDRRVV
ncbi:uncharacterized protein DS421_16g544570 [Arachis hypogaea]|nr:uncharacterized protein DS421_16g544570 [Arachis hypogaea]